MKAKYEVLVIGGSAGSLDVILHILPLLHNDLGGLSIIIVLHRKHSNDNILTDLLSMRTTIPVKEIDEKDTIKPNTIYIAPANYHILIEENHTFSLDASEKVNYSRPSIDVTFISVADIYESGAAALLLSGANTDGTNGLKAIKKKGGLTLVQDPSTAEVDYMPKFALTHAKVDKVLVIDEMAAFINHLNT